MKIKVPIPKGGENNLESKFLKAQIKNPPKSEPSHGPWPDWIASEEGKKCADPYTLDLAYRMGEFLENRLWHAFMAGMKAERESVADCRAQASGMEKCK